MADAGIHACRPTIAALALSLFAASFALGQEDGSAGPQPQQKESLAVLERQAGSSPPESGDKRELCVFFHQRGMANARLGRYDRAVGDLRQALGLQQESWLVPNQWCDRWRLQNDLSTTLAEAGDHLARIQHLKAIGAELANSSTRRHLFSQLFMIDSYVALGMLKDAEEAFGRATASLPEVRSRKDWRTEQFNVMDVYSRYAGWLQELRGNYGEAERFRRAALDNARQYLPVMRGLFPEESQNVRIARDNVAGAMRHLASNLSAQGKLGEAEHLAHDALSQILATSSFNTVGTSNALSILGAIQLQQGKVSEAARYIELSSQALEASSVKPYSTTLAARRSQMGLILGIQGRWDDALKLFEKRDQGLRSSAEQFAKSGSNHIDWAAAMLKTGQAAKAADMLRKMLDFNLRKPFVDPLYLAHLRGYLGMALTGQGDVNEALVQFQQSLPTLLRRARDEAGNEDSGFVRGYRLRQILEGYLELLAKLPAAGVAGVDVVAETFRIADIARNSSVQRAVTASAARAKLPNSHLAELARREQDANNRIQALNRILARIASAPEGQRLQKVMNDMRRDMEALAAEQARLKKEISDQFPDYANLVDPQPAAPADIQRLLAPDEAVVAIYGGERQSYVWTIARQGVGFRAVPLGREQIARGVAAIRRGMDLSGDDIKDFDGAAAYRLYGALLAPDASLWSTARLLNVIPHGALGQLPFAMLLTGPVKTTPGAKPSYADLPWLIGKLAIAQQSSVSSFMALRNASVVREERKPFVGFGDPLFVADGASPAARRGIRSRKLEVEAARDETLALIELAKRAAQPGENPKPTGRPTLAQAFSYLPPLPDTADELRDIAQTTGANPNTDLFLGAGATEASLKAADLSRYRIVAFATHGLVPGELSGLDQPALAMANPALARDSDNDGFLTLQEVLGLKLNADWVVLSACNTASADGNASEAVSGLGRAFFYAGTRSLLVSNWAVETVSARLLTTGLFRQQSLHPAMPRAEALRQSMLTVMRGQGGEYSHPVFWAPFSLVGDGLSQ